MRYLITPLSLILTMLFVGFSNAQDDNETNEDRNDRRAEMRQRILDEFDENGDGELSDTERATAREEMRRRRGGRAGQGEPGERRPQREGAGRRGGPGAPPDPGQLFDKYDANGDGQLSLEEFKKLSEEMRANRPPRPRRPGADRDNARPRPPARPDGPPREGSTEERRRRFDRERALDNPDDRPGPPPARPAARRRSNDEDAPRPRGRAARDPRGPQGEGFRPPSPEAIFKRFDENGDAQLSRAEFMKLADRMRQMQERFGAPGEPGGERDRMRERRGPRPGPPGEEGPQRRRPRRPRAESDAESRGGDDNSV